MLGSEAGLGRNCTWGRINVKALGQRGWTEGNILLEENLGARGCLGGTCALATHFTLGEMAWGTGWTGLGLWGSWPGQTWGVRSMGESRVGCQEVTRQWWLLELARQTALG